MRRLFFISFFFWFLPIVLTAQPKQRVYVKELTLLTENDNYDTDLSDRYYTNGFVAQWNWLKQEVDSRRFQKQIHRLELGHKVFTPVSVKDSVAAVVRKMDRPFAGWLYAQYGTTLIFHNKAVLQADAVAGLLGPSAFGRQVQQQWHRLWKLYKVYGWDYQLNDAFTLGVQAAYFYPLAGAGSRSASLYGVSKIALGTAFTNAAAGFLFQTGRLRTAAQSAYWNANLGTAVSNTEKREWIFFMEPLLLAQAYNATIQGGLFRSDKGPFTTGIRPFLFQTRTGLLLTGRKMGFRWFYTIRGREGSLMKKREHWGSIGLTYRFQ